MQHNPPFSRPQRIALAGLGLLILLAFIFWRAVPYLFSTENNMDDLKAQQEWATYSSNKLRTDSGTSWIENESNQGNFYSNEYPENEVSLQNIAYAPKAFDPNTSSIETMIASGMPIRSAKSILKYRSKGGKYYKTEDLLKMYNLPAEDYKKVAPYVKITPLERQRFGERSYENSSSYTKYDRPAEPSSLNINTATEAQWMTLKGIGPGYSKWIVEQRNRLGGFVTTAQVAEVYGLPDSTWQHIKDRLVVTSGSIKKINVNTASEEELAAHPYIRPFMAKNIVKLRNDVKQFKKVEDLRQVPLINEEKYRKIVPYISVE